MITNLFSEEQIMEIHDYHIAKAARKEGFIEGFFEVWTGDRTEGTLSCMKGLMKTLGLSIEEAIDALKIPENERSEYLSRLKQ